MTGEFSEVTRAGKYQIRVVEEVSAPFVIQPDAWRRHLPMVLVIFVAPAKEVCRSIGTAAVSIA